MMQGIATKRGDQMSRFQNALYLGDAEARVAVLRDTGMCEWFAAARSTYLSDVTLRRRKTRLLITPPRATASMPWLRRSWKWPE